MVVCTRNRAVDSHAALLTIIASLHTEKLAPILRVNGVAIRDIILAPGQAPAVGNATYTVSAVFGAGPNRFSRRHS